MDLVALLRVASLDAELSRLQGSFREIVGLLEQQSADLAALGTLVDAERARVTGVKNGPEQVARGRHDRLRDGEAACAELAGALERDRADALALSAELQSKTVALTEERRTSLARVSPPLAGLYEALLREGRHPALASLREGACVACGARFDAVAGQGLHDACQVIPCPACGRLLYDRSWVERDSMPPTLGTLRRAGP